MTKGLTIAGLVFLAFMMDTSFFASFNIFGIAPDSMLLLVVSLSLIGGSGYGAITGVCGGFLLDLVTGRAIGVYALIYLLLGALVGLFRAKVFRDNFILPALTAAVAYFIKDMYVMLYALAIGVNFNAAFMVVRATLPGVAINFLLMIPAFLILKKLHGLRYMRIRRKDDQLDFVN